MPAVPPAEDYAVKRELELTRALLRQARADRDRLQDAATVSGNRVLELDDKARRVIRRAESAEQAVRESRQELAQTRQELRETRQGLRETQQALLHATRVRRRLARERDALVRRLPGRTHRAAPVPGAEPSGSAPGVPAPVAPVAEAAAQPLAEPSPQPEAEPSPQSAPAWPELPDVVCLDVTTLRDPARSGIARVTIRLAQELDRLTAVRLVTITNDRLVRDPAFDEEIFGQPAVDADRAGAAVRGGAGVRVFSAAIQRDAEIPGWQAEIARIRAEGGRYAQVVHDLLPVTLPDFFDLTMRRRFPPWLDFVARNADVLFADSRATREDLLAWTGERGLTMPAVRVLALGADPVATVPAEVQCDARPLLLMVGVVEPRKSVDIVVDAVEALRSDGHDIALTIVGKRGWAAADLIERLEQLNAEAEWFTWEEQADDTALAAWYRRSRLLVAASRGEGYGLPLAEALASGLPVLARDLPVFREIVADDGHYFDLDARLPQAILDALAQPTPPGRQLPTWHDAAVSVAQALGIEASADRA